MQPHRYSTHQCGPPAKNFGHPWFASSSSFVPGVREAFNPYAVLELSSASSNADEVRIKGLETGLYLAINSDGNLYAEPDPNNESTIFIEGTEGHYLTYLR